MKFIPIVALLVAIIFLLPPVSAETFTLLWTEDFCDGSDWTIDPSTDFDSTPPCKWRHIDGNGIWRGATYRSAAGSTWNDATSTILKIQITDLELLTISPNNQNRQMGFSIDADHGVMDSTGSDYLRFKLVADAPGATFAWIVNWKDDGGTQHSNVHTISDIAGGGVQRKLDANITINTQILRYWINWTTRAPNVLGSDITGLWTNDVDGPFAESNAQYVNLWSYSSQVGVPVWSIDELTLSTAGEVVAPSTTQADPFAGHGQAHADFLYSYTVFGVQFHDESNAPGKIISWVWNFGDGYGARNNSRPLHQYPCEGNYMVYLKVTDIYGNSDNVTKPVAINESQLTCGVLQKYDGGIAVNLNGGWITIPQAFFLFLVVASGLSIGMRLEIPGIPMVLRKLFFVVSLVMLLVTYGLLTWFL